MVKFAEQAVARLAGLAPLPQPAIVPVQYPVILMHGFGMLAGLRRGGHLHATALSLRLRGVRAYAPNVAPYCPVSVRTQMWQQHIEHVLDETRADRVHLIAQSMGGLDARHLISVQGLHEVVASLTTISTPHHGSALADFVLEQPERLRLWTAEIVNWLGASALTCDVASDVAQAVAELTPSYLRTVFNPAVPDHPSVRYWSYAACAGKGTSVPLSNPLLGPLNLLLYRREGPNDGFVSAESAKWGTFLGTILADHSQQVGIQVLRGGSFDAHRFYGSIVERLAREGM